MNLLDKYVVSHRIRKPLGYAVLAGGVNLVAGGIAILFLDWQGVGFSDIAFAVASGLLLALDLVLYYVILSKDDVSELIDIEYVSPVLTALLAWIFLGEMVGLAAAACIAIIVLGALLLAKSKDGIWKRKNAGVLILILLAIATYEFLIKMSTTRLGLMQGIALNQFALGAGVMVLLLSRKVRKDAVRALHLWPWALLTESFTIGAIATTYIAMAGMKAAIVSSILAIQPLLVLVLEQLADRSVGKMQHDHNLALKIAAAALIVVGVIFLTLTAG
jgi:drug/metabolite transporter (DMT)-like permease